MGSTRLAVTTAAMLYVLALVTIVPIAHAQGAATDADDQEARSLYEAGARAYSSGRYDRALEHFQHAYELSHRPQLLFNIAQAADHLRQDAVALQAYEGYLAALAPDHADRAQVQSRIEILRAATAAHDATTTTTTTTTTSDVPVVSATTDTTASDDASSSAPPPPAPAPASDGPPAGSWVLTLGGAAVAIGGIVMVGVAGAENATVQNAPAGSAYDDYAGHLDTANTLAIAGGVALGVGAACAVIGGVWIATSGSSSASLRLDLGPGGLRLSGSF